MTVLRWLVRAISDPGAVLQRGDDYSEPIVCWSARAVQAVLVERLESSEMADALDAVTCRLAQEKEDRIEQVRDAYLAAMSDLLLSQASIPARP